MKNLKAHYLNIAELNDQVGCDSIDQVVKKKIATIHSIGEFLRPLLKQALTPPAPIHLTEEPFDILPLTSGGVNYVMGERCTGKTSMM